jgi:cytochrome c5
VPGVYSIIRDHSFCRGKRPQGSAAIQSSTGCGFHGYQLNQEKTLSHDKQFFTTFAAVLIGLGVLAVILYFIAGYLTSDVSDYEPKEVVLENIKPVGQVYIAGQPGAPEATAAGEPAAAAGEAAAPKSGEQVYQSNCIACHGTGAAGAPKMGDAAAWAPRIAKGMDALLKSATNGLKAMPPKGLCMACSEDELKGAIQYMVSKSQ